MRAEDIEDLQADVFEEHGEPVTVAGVVLRAVWRPSGSETGGAAESAITNEADTFAFRRRDRESQAPGASRRDHHAQQRRAVPDRRLRPALRRALPRDRDGGTRPRLNEIASPRECSHPRARRRAPAGAPQPIGRRHLSTVAREVTDDEVLDVIRAAGREVRIAHVARALGLTPGDAGKLLNDLADPRAADSAAERADGVPVAIRPAHR